MNRLVFPSDLTGMTDRLRKLIVLTALVGIAGAGMNFMLRGAVLMDDVSGMYDPDILSLLWDTPPGDVMLLRGIGAALLIIGALIAGSALWLSLIGGLVIIWSFAAIGHVQGIGGLWLQFILTAHLLIAAFWIGIFTPLRRLSHSADTLTTAARVGRQFGLIAAIAVPVLIGAGVIMSWKLVGSFEALWSTPYGIALLVKSATVGGLLSLAAANKLRYVPALQGGDIAAGRSLWKSIQFEWACVWVILLVTATFTSVLTLPS